MFPFVFLCNKNRNSEYCLYIEKKNCSKLNTSQSRDQAGKELKWFMKEFHFLGELSRAAFHFLNLSALFKKGHNIL